MPLIIDESKMTPEQRRWWRFTKHVNSVRRAVADAESAAAWALRNGSASDVFKRLDHARCKLELAGEEVRAAIEIAIEIQREQGIDPN